MKTRTKRKAKMDLNLEREFYDLWHEIKQKNSNPEIRKFKELDSDLMKSKEVKKLLELRYSLYLKHEKLLNTFLYETKGCAHGITEETKQELALAFLTYIFNYNPYLGYTVSTFMYRVLHGATMSAFYQLVYCLEPSIYLATNRRKVNNLTKTGVSTIEAYDSLKLTKEQRWLLDNCKFHSSGASPERFLDDRCIAGYEDKLWMLHSGELSVLLEALSESPISDGLKSKIKAQLEKGVDSFDSEEINKIYNDYLVEANSND
jgi:hypothetical protein